VGIGEAGEEAQGGGLAGAVGADEQGDLAGFDGEVEAGEHAAWAEGFLQVAGDDHGAVGRLSSGCGSLMPGTPGRARRLWMKRRRRSPGLAESRPTAGKERRQPPKRAGSRCGVSAMPPRSRSGASAPAQGVPRPSTDQVLVEAPRPLSTGWMLPRKVFSVKRLSAVLLLTRMPTWLPVMRLARTVMWLEFSSRKPRVLPAMTLSSTRVSSTDWKSRP